MYYYNNNHYMKEELQAIDTLRSLLGTMVLMPKYKSDPNAIGSKVFEGNEQVPIIMGENRNIIEGKIMQMIKTL